MAGSRRLAAQDDSVGMDGALNALIQCWNQYGPNADNYGLSWTADPNYLAAVMNAYSSLAGSWSGDGTDFNLQEALSEGTVQGKGSQMLSEAAGGAYQTLLSRGAILTSSQFWSWYSGWGVDWDSAMTVLQTEALSSVVQDLAAAVAVGGDATMAASAVMLGAAIAQGAGFFGAYTNSPIAAAADIAAAVAMLGVQTPSSSY